MASKKRRRSKPTSQSRHWRTLLSTDPERSIKEEERIRQKDPKVGAILDFFATKREPYDGCGWSAFNDWLDAVYFRHIDEQPPEIEWVSIEEISEVVFPIPKK